MKQYVRKRPMAQGFLAFMAVRQKSPKTAKKRLLIMGSWVRIPPGSPIKSKTYGRFLPPRGPREKSWGAAGGGKST
jgi:hypothetical protein